MEETKTDTQQEVRLKCKDCGYDYDERIVRYYSDEMNEADLICPHCQSRNFTQK